MLILVIYNCITFKFMRCENEIHLKKSKFAKKDTCITVMHAYKHVQLVLKTDTRIPNLTLFL